MDGRETAPVIRVSRDVHRRGRNEPVDRSCPVDTQIMSEPSVRFEHRMDWIDDTVMGPEGQEGCLGEPNIVSHRNDSTGSVDGKDRPVCTKQRVYTQAGPLGFEVKLGGNITNWPDSVGKSGGIKQSVFPDQKAGQEGCISTNSTHPDVTMFSTQPGSEVSAGPDGARHSVDHVSPFPVHDDDRLEVGGPVGRFPYSDIRQTNDRSVLNVDRRDDVVGKQSVFVPFTDVRRMTDHQDT